MEKEETMTGCADIAMPVSNTESFEARCITNGTNFGIRTPKVTLAISKGDLARYVYEAEAKVLHLHFRDNNYIRLDFIEENIVTDLGRFIFDIGVN